MSKKLLYLYSLYCIALGMIKIKTIKLLKVNDRIRLYSIYFLGKIIIYLIDISNKDKARLKNRVYTGKITQIQNKGRKKGNRIFNLWIPLKDIPNCKRPVYEYCGDPFKGFDFSKNANVVNGINYCDYSKDEQYIKYFKKYKLGKIKCYKKVNLN